MGAPPPPGRAPPRRGVLHGGFWRGIWNLRLTKMSADLALRGWAAFNVEYRRNGRLGGGGWPNTFLDVAAAIDHTATMASVESGEHAGYPSASGRVT